MIVISEWLPNPAGNDAKGEWVEMRNTGSEPASTAGWVLKNEKGKAFGLPTQTVAPGGYVIFKKPELSLALRNTNGGVALFNPSGRKIQAIEFLGTAPEGKSFGTNGEGFSWLTPTPNEINQVPQTSFAAQPLALGIPLHAPIFPVSLSIFFPILITAVVLYTVKQDEVLSKLFFGGHTADSEDESLAYTFKEEI